MTVDFERNLAALEARQPNLAAQIRGLENKETAVVGSPGNGDLNIDLGHGDFYSVGAEEFATGQISGWLKNPDRLDIGWISDTVPPNTYAERFHLRLSDWLKERDLYRRPKELDPDGGFLVVFGLGLGLHIKPLIRDLPVRNLIIIEQMSEFVSHALETCDVEEWYEEVEARKGRLQFIVEDDPRRCSNTLYWAMRERDYGLIYGSYLYTHYKSAFLQEARADFVERLPLLSANPGFFEDELVMMNNCLENLIRYDFTDYVDRLRQLKTTPVFIVGSGPSVDSSVELLENARERAIIVSCGSALGALLGYGITPDFHVETENTPGPYEILSELAEAHDFSPITLIAANTVHPEVPKLFKRRLFYFRDTVISSHYFGRNRSHVYLASPTVTNAGMRIMLGMGCRELYLVGVDLGSRDPGRHHSEKSIYVADETFLEEHPDHARQTKYKIRRTGNFGGTIYTNQSFLNAGMYMVGLVGRFSEARIYNLSDGLLIRGTIPKLPDVVSVEDFPKHKEADLRQIGHEMKAKDLSDLVDLEGLRDLHARVDEFYKNLLIEYRRWDTEKADTLELYDLVSPYFYVSSNDPIDKVLNGLNVGTQMMMFLAINIAVHGIPKDARADFSKFAIDIVIEKTERMRDEAMEAVASYIERAQRAA